jgi:MerR family transcriptional regulator, light-induced transcriptional regulator
MMSAMPATTGDQPVALAISEVARLTGLTTPTLRVWQRRYGLGASRSSAGGHRRYSPLDVARLRAVQQLVAQGLPTAEAARVVLGPVQHGFDLLPEADPTAHLLAAAALDLDGPSCRSLLHEHLATHPVERTWEDVLRPVLGVIGDRWSELPHGIAVEHLLSHIAAATLEATVPTATPGPPAVMLACVPMEEHDLPLVALATALDQHGIGTTLLGAATPTGALIHAIERGRPSVVMLLALLPVLADPGVLAALPPTDLLVAAGPGWEGSVLPGGVERIDDLPGAIRMIREELGPG